MMKIAKSILGTLAAAAVLFATTAFIMSDAQADFNQQTISLSDQVSLSEITIKNLEIGTFKSSLEFEQASFECSTKEFYGQKIIIADNPHIDQILIGVTNNLISRIEIWNNDQLIETRELGFMDKMTWGEKQTLTIEFQDQTNSKYNGESRISMRFYSGTGFFGDIGTMNIDLTEYGDLSGNKSIGVFAKSLDSNSLNEPEFSDLRIWKNYRSWD